MHQALAQKIRPVPQWRCAFRENPADPSTGFFLCIVPKSRLAPHAVIEDERLRYVVRDQLRSRPLAEHEVADRYRERGVRGAQSEARLAQVVRDGRNGWRPRECVLELALVPLEQGQLTLSSPLIRSLRDRLSALPSQHVLKAGTAEPSTGLRRVRVRSGSMETSPYYAELHTDGAGYLAVAIKPWSRGDDDPLLLDRSVLFLCLAEQLHELLVHARSCSCSGDVYVSAVFTHVSGAVPPTLRLQPKGDYHLWARKLPPPPQGPIEATRTIQLESSGREMPLLLRSILTDFYQAFGEPEIEIIDSEGFVSRENWKAVSGFSLAEIIRDHSAFDLDDVR